MLPPITLEVWRGVVTPFHVLAMCCTIFRLWHRRRKRQLWWDDYWAAIALIFDVMYTTTPFLRSKPPVPQKKGIVVFWLTTVTLPLVCWSARISIGMSIARIVPPNTRPRYLLYGMNGLFGLMCIGQELHKIVVCTAKTSWHNNASVTCYMGGVVGWISLSMDLVADTCLVAIPLRMLWRVRLPRTQRRLILCIFSSTIVNSAFCIIYFSFVLKRQTEGSESGWGVRIGFVSGIKTAIILLVCNMLVVVTYLYCIFWKDDDEDVSEPSETRSKPSQPIPPTIPPTSAIQLTDLSRSGMHATDSASFAYVRSAPCKPSPFMGRLDRRQSQ